MFTELVKRDFKQKYKRSILGMGWSILSPLLQLLIMRIVLPSFCKRHSPLYGLFVCGQSYICFFKESTTGGMGALMSNASIFTKINVPKYIFLLTKNVSAIINFAITLLIFFLFVAIDGIAFSWRFLMLFYPIICLLVFNIGIGLILSALFVFFRDTQYLYDIITLLLMYLSAIFYSVDVYPPNIQRLFLLNPIYCVIKYIRVIVIDGNIPSQAYHLLLLAYALVAVGIGGWIYKRQNHKFLYYV